MATPKRRNARQRPPNPKPLFLLDSDSPAIATVSDLVRIVGTLKRPVYFRGHEDRDWSLKPTIARISEPDNEKTRWAGRTPPDWKPLDQERALLHRFRRHSYEHRGRVLTEWEVLFLARHHGLPTRLLDWTWNPLVALYFAAQGTEKKDGVVWYTRRTPVTCLGDVDVFAIGSPLDVRDIRWIYPFYPTPRMTSQSGLFSIHPYPWIDLTKEPRPVGCELIGGGGLLIRKGKKGDLLCELERLGVNERVLFPDLDGLARGLMRTEVFRTRQESPP